MTGTVYLVGSGPGDPKLLTIRGLELIKKADVILYDRLVSKEVLSLIPTTTKKIYVGRSIADDYNHQDNTNQLMLSYSKKLRIVVRLKGGDPMIFGRGGEEAEYLHKHMIKFEIIPGISSGIGSATYSGIPLTHRKISSTILFITGNEDYIKKHTTVKWEKFVDNIDTIVIFMGLSKITYIKNKLIQGGINKNTPVAVIQNGTMQNQKTITGTISNITNKIMKSKIKSPSIIIIGNVVHFTNILNWRKNNA